MSGKLTRIDLLVAERFSISRSRAQALVLAGKVLVADGKGNFVKITRPSRKVEPSVDIKISSREPVSRGYYKIKGAYEFLEDAVKSGVMRNSLLKEYSPENKVCADVGSSTGGFVQFLLESGARVVYAVDVGKGLLDFSLRKNEKVVVKEGVNARYLEPGDFDRGLPELLTCDVSFISSLKIIPTLAEKLWVASGGRTPLKVVLLIKPQFEIDFSQRKFLKKGVLKDEHIRKEVLGKVLENYREVGFVVDFYSDSKIAGKDGNLETVAFMRYPALRSV